MSKKPHWTTTPKGRKKMAEIAKKGRAALAKKMASGEIVPWQRTPEGRARLSQLGRAGTNGRPDIPETTRKKIAERMAAGGFGTAEALAREYKLSSNTVRAWAKRYGGHAVAVAKSNGGDVAWGAHRRDVPQQTRELIAKRYNSGKANSPELAREYGVSTTTVRDWAKRYVGNGASREKGAGGPRPDIPTQTRVMAVQRLARGESASELAREIGVNRSTVTTWAKNGLHASNRVRSMGMQACGACRTCLLCQKLGAEPQWIMCLVANPLEPGGVA